MRIVYTPRARDDLASILASIEAVSPSGAVAVAARIENTVKLLEEHPRAARVVRAQEGVRRIAIGRYPYNIFYQVADDAVIILHIRHGKRRPPRRRDLT